MGICEVPPATASVPAGEVSWGSLHGECSWEGKGKTQQSYRVGRWAGSLGEQGWPEVWSWITVKPTSLAQHSSGSWVQAQREWSPWTL